MKIKYAALFFIVTVLAIAGSSSMSHAQCPACPGDCPQGAQIVRDDHETGEQCIIAGKNCKNQSRGSTTNISTPYGYSYLIKRMTEHKFWTLEDFFIQHFLPRLMEFSRQLTAVAMEQMRLVGMFFDAKHLMDQTRNLQELQVRANKDYHPSESFCWWGTNVRSLANTEIRARYNQAALARIAQARQLGNYNNAAADVGRDLTSRWRNFQSTYCDPSDNGWRGSESGLQAICGNAPPVPERTNKDVDYTRFVDFPRTLEVDFHNEALSADEEDIIALSNNLYGNDPTSKEFRLEIEAGSGKRALSGPGFMDMRAITAKRAVAQESFNAIVGLKSQSEETNEADVTRFLAAILRDAGLDAGQNQNPAEIFDHLGERPSYYAQLEVLSKRIAQNPNFFVNLIDKPANVERTKAALNAIDLMLERAIFESELRQEMVLSVLLAASQNDEYRDIFARLPTPVSKEGAGP